MALHSTLCTIACCNGPHLIDKVYTGHIESELIQMLCMWIMLSAPLLQHWAQRYHDRRVSAFVGFWIWELMLLRWWRQSINSRSVNWSIIPTGQGKGTPGVSWPECFSAIQETCIFINIDPGFFWLAEMETVISPVCHFTLYSWVKIQCFFWMGGKELSCLPFIPSAEGKSSVLHCANATKVPCSPHGGHSYVMEMVHLVWLDPSNPFQVKWCKLEFYFKIMII